jgi:hypothetical protein
LEGSTIFEGGERQNLHNPKVKNAWEVGVFNIINNGIYNNNHNKKSIEASKDAKVANSLRVVKLDNVNLQHQNTKQ